MTILRAGTLLLMLGLAAPLGMVWALPAHADGGDGGDGDGGDGDGDDGDGDSEGTADDDADDEGATAPTPNFSTLSVGMTPSLNVQGTFRR